MEGGHRRRPSRGRSTVRAPRARLPRVSRARARPVAQHAGRLSLRPAPVRRVPQARRPRRPHGGPRGAVRVPGRACDGQRGAASRRARDAAAQGGVPALVLPPPPARGDRPPRRDGGPPRSASQPAPAAGPDPRRGRTAARAAAGHGADRPARPGDARAHVRVRAARLRGDRPHRRRPRPRDRGAARARQGLQGADRPDRPPGRRGRARVPPAGPSHAGRAHPRGAPVRQPARRRTHPPGPLQDRPAPRGHRGARDQDEPAHAAAHLRDPSARRRMRPARPPGDARPRRRRDDPDLHAPLRRPAEGRVLLGAPARAAPRARRRRRPSRSRGLPPQMGESRGCARSPTRVARGP